MAVQKKVLTKGQVVTHFASDLKRTRLVDGCGEVAFLEIGGR